jgi:hypothetical protein
MISTFLFQLVSKRSNMMLPFALLIYLASVIVMQQYPSLGPVADKSEILDPISLKIWQFDTAMNRETINVDEVDGLLKSLSASSPDWTLREIFPNASGWQSVRTRLHIPFRCYGSDEKLRQETALELSVRT